MTFELCSSAAIVAKAGKNVNSDAAASNTLLSQYSDEAHAFLNTFTRFDFTANVATLNPAASAAAQQVISALGAIDLITFDETSYQLGEADNVRNILNYKAFLVLKLLENDNPRQFLIDGSTGVE